MNIEVETLNEPFVLAISLDKASEEPLHQQISEPLRTMILNNELNPGQLLEDEVGMAKRLDTSRTTVRRAFQNLADAGLLSRQRGVGTRVTLPPIHRKVSLTSLFDDLKDAGLEPETEILQYKIQFAGPETASHLDCDDDSEVVHIKRLRYSRGRPLAVLTNILMASKAPTPRSLTESGLYEQLKADGSAPASAFQQVGARRATPEEAELLLIDEGAAVITVERTVYTENDEVVDLEEDVYDASQYLLTFSLHAE